MRTCVPVAIEAGRGALLPENWLTRHSPGAPPLPRGTLNICPHGHTHLQGKVESTAAREPREAPRREV